MNATSYLHVIARSLAGVEWIRRGVRDRIARATCNPEHCQSKPFSVDFFGYRYRGDLSSYIDWNVYFYGAYEKPLLELVRRLLQTRTGSIALDIGANVGHHSLAMARWASHVHAFEPFPAVADVLRRRLSENAISHVTVHPFGLGEQDAQLDYYAPNGRSNQGTGSFVAAHAAGYNEIHGQLSVRYADPVIEDLKLDRLDFIKLDVEGFEKHVLRGLARTLRKYRPFLLMEHSIETRTSLADANELFELLPENYVVNTVLADRPFAVLFNRPDCVLAPFDFERVPAYLLMRPGETPADFEQV